VVLAQPQLERFFNPALHRWARNEMEIVSASGVMRLDRVVMFDDEVWVLDYKRRLLESERVITRRSWPVIAARSCRSFLTSESGLR
jgi:ATP-dependent helicase/nuclease subunit A